jgi:hypothetical protein
MKITSLRTLALVGIGALALLASTKPASAYVSIRVGVAPPPPPNVVYQPWAPPYRGAVWIPGHNEWVGGRWVWVGGYYDYPPRRGAVWVPAHWARGYYHPGHWRY